MDGISRANIGGTQKWLCEITDRIRINLGFGTMNLAKRCGRTQCRNIHPEVSTLIGSHIADIKLIGVEVLPCNRDARSIDIQKRVYGDIYRYIGSNGCTIVAIAYSVPAWI